MARISVVLPMVTFVPGGMGGSEHYALHLIEELVRSTDIQVTAVVNAAAAGTTAAREVVARRVGGGGSTAQRLVSLVRAQAPGRPVRRVMSAADVVHFPFTVPVPSPSGRPYVQTLHDVQHLDMPGFFSAPERHYRRLLYDRPARRAARVVTISEFSRSRIVEVLGIDPAIVAVAPPGVTLPSRTTWTGGGGYVLYPARMWPHKNHTRLLAAMEIVRGSHDLRLVLTGGGAPRDPMPAWVENRGLVSRGELDVLIQQASCLAFPSLYEGFGMPVLEAMAAGCPVASSTAGALGEVCGSAAVMFDPRDVASMAGAISEAVLSGPDLSEAGRRRAAGFTWDRTATVHRDLYHSVSDSAGGSRG